MIIQFFIVIFAIFVLAKVILRFKVRDITGRELLAWIVFLLLVILAALWPQKTDVVARLVGVERGVDLLVYISVIVLFFVVFKVAVRLEKIDKQTTKVIRELALRQKFGVEEKPDHHND